jgi:LytS/YehU family sensor histidine kinase
MLFRCDFVPVKKNKDKYCHFVVGLLISFWIGIFTSPMIGIIVGVIAGVLKETYDYKSYGLFDKKDLLVTSFGATLAGGLIYLGGIYG